MAARLRPVAVYPPGTWRDRHRTAPASATITASDTKHPAPRLTTPIASRAKVPTSSTPATVSAITPERLLDQAGPTARITATVGAASATSDGSAPAMSRPPVPVGVSPANPQMMLSASPTGTSARAIHALRASTLGFPGPMPRPGRRLTTGILTNSDMLQMFSLHSEESPVQGRKSPR